MPNAKPWLAATLAENGPRAGATPQLVDEGLPIPKGANQECSPCDARFLPLSCFLSLS